MKKGCPLAPLGLLGRCTSSPADLTKRAGNEVPPWGTQSLKHLSTWGKRVRLNSSVWQGERNKRVPWHEHDVLSGLKGAQQEGVLWVLCSHVTWDYITINYDGFAFFIVLTDIDTRTQDNKSHWVSLHLYVVDIQLQNVQRLFIFSYTICKILEQTQKPLG